MHQVQSKPQATVIAFAESDNALLKLVQDRQQEAFKQLYERHLPTVYGLCLRLTGSNQQAEDATQEVFIQLWRKSDQFREESSFSTWLHSLASNTTISYLRKQKSWFKRIVYTENFESLEAGLEDSPPADISSLLIWLPHLPERARLVFVLHGIEGYRQEQVAKLMGISIGTVKAQFHKASTQLKQWLNESTGESA